MTNRLKELENNLPKTERAIIELINCIASHTNIADDNITSSSIRKLTNEIREELEND